MSHNPPPLTQTTSSKFENESQNDRWHPWHGKGGRTHWQPVDDRWNSGKPGHQVTNFPRGDQCALSCAEPIDISLVYFLNRQSGMFSFEFEMHYWTTMNCIRKLSVIKSTLVSPRGKFVTWCPGLPEFQRSSTGCQCVHLFRATDANGRFVTHFRTSIWLFVSMEEVRVTLCRRKVWEFIRQEFGKGGSVNSAKPWPCSRHKRY